MNAESQCVMKCFVKFVNEGADGDEEAKGADGPSLPATASVTGLGG